MRNLTLIVPDALTAIKLHFGERGNDSHLRPQFVTQVVQRVKASRGKPFVTDANTRTPEVGITPLTISPPRSSTGSATQFCGPRHHL